MPPPPDDAQVLIDDLLNKVVDLSNLPLDDPRRNQLPELQAQIKIVTDYRGKVNNQ